MIVSDDWDHSEPKLTPNNWSSNIRIIVPGGMKTAPKATENTNPRIRIAAQKMRGYLRMNISTCRGG
jgi:hypothetical protein